MKSVSIRSATVDDVGFMWEMLYEAVHWPPERDEQKPSREEVSADPEISHYLEGWGRRGDVGFVAVEGGERLGAAWQRLMTAEDPGYGFVDEETPEIAVAVVPEARGRGIGGLLMEAVIEAARSSGYEEISLSVDRTNPAVRLYELCGFRGVETRETDLLMKLDLTR